MTLNEFKAWLDGFEAARADAPTAEQWATIKAKLKTVTMASPPIEPPFKRYFGGGGYYGGGLLGSMKAHADGKTRVIPEDDPFKDLSGE